MCFWLAVYTENACLVQRLMEFDVYLRQLVTLAMMNFGEKPYKYQKEREKKKLNRPNLG